MSQRIDEVLQAAVDAGDVPCVVAMAADDSGVVYEGSTGMRTPEAQDPVGPDTMFRIASMTKMVTTVAALQQVERGNLNLDAPIETVLPQFADLQVLEGFDGDTPRMRAPASQATVRQLATHTTGLAYFFWNADLVRWEHAPARRTSSRARGRSSPPRSWPIRAPPSSTGSTPTGSAWSSRPRATSRWTRTSPSTSPGRSGWRRPPSR